MAYKTAALAAAFWCAAGSAQVTNSHRRMSPSEIGALEQVGPSAGTSGVTGIQTRVLKGDPTRSGLYTIQLEVPANTHIDSHVHPDDRVATVISGTWYFGYGTRFEEKELKALPPGSFYTEPPDEPHFARTGSAAVIVQITGFGPTGTRFTEAHPSPLTKP